MSEKDDDKELADMLKKLVGFTPEGIRKEIEQQAGDIVDAKVGKLAENLSNILEGQENAVMQKVEELLGKIDIKAGHQTIEIIDRGEKRTIKGVAHPVMEKVMHLAPLPHINPLLVGPAGCGKTQMAAMIAEAMGLEFYSQSMSEGVTEGKLIGRETRDGYIEGIVERVMRDGGFLLADEVDASLDNVLIVLNSSLANGWMLNGRGERIVKHDDCIIVASANTYGRGADRLYCGRDQLDAATMDRFYTIDMDYDKNYEVTQGTKELCDWVWGMRSKAEQNRLRVVISTRMIQKGMSALNAGFELAEVKRDLLAPFTDDERQQLAA